MGRKKLWGSLSLMAMLILIIDARHAVNGAIQGLELCLYTVIPALFPYCVLSMIFQSAASGSHLKYLQPLEKICRMPKGSGIILLLGVLGGYPTGAICAERAALNKNDTSNMVIFCNNAGPSFIFGIVSLIFPGFQTLITIWLIQIMSAILTGMILNAKAKPGNYEVKPIIKKSNVILDAAGAMANVCGTIILFKVIITCMESWLLKLLPDSLYTIIIGLSELTNGITYLNKIDNEAIRFVACCGLLSFGGICVAMQTLSVTKSVSLSKYLAGKALQGSISMVLAGSITYNLYLPLALILIVVIAINISVKKKKAVAFSA